MLVLAATACVLAGAQANSVPPPRSGGAAIGLRSVPAKIAASIKAIRARVAHRPELGNVALVIRKAKDANVTCTVTTSVVCAPSGPNAVLSVVQLAKYLAKYSVTINTGGNPGSISFQAPLTWSSANSLTLDAYNSVVVDAKIVDAGPGALTITTGDGDGSKSTDILTFREDSSIAFFSTANALVVNGTTYTLVSNVLANQKSLAKLAAAVANNPNGNFALGAYYNAANDGVYQGGVVPRFAGNFTALGNTINNLKGNNGGLFGVQVAGTIANVRLLHAAITGNGTAPSLGAVVNVSAGNLIDDSVGGSVSLTVSGNCTAGGYGYDVGGLAGSVQNSVAVVASVSAATVSGSDAGCTSGAEQFYLGGLIGLATEGSIIDSSASGSVTYDGFSGTAGDLGTGYAGGLVGENWGAIIGSHATGFVTTSGTYLDAGGLVGLEVYSEVALSYATGNVIVNVTNPSGGAAGSAGGLAGRVYSNGTATDCGTTIQICQSFASGNVSVAAGAAFTIYAGGLIGAALDSFDSVQYVYATGSATTSNNSSGAFNAAGGLIGIFGGTIDQGYSIGPVAAIGPEACLGGLIGQNSFNPGFVTSSYWDTQTSGTNNAIGTLPGCPGDVQGSITGLTTQQFLAGLPQGFDSTWTQDQAHSSGFPYLVNNPPPH